MNARTDAKIDLNSLNKMVLVEMVKIIDGQAGDYARLSKDHYVSILMTKDQETIERAFDEVVAKQPQPAQAAPHWMPAQKPAAPAPAAPAKAQSMDAAGMLAEAMRLLMPAAPVDEAAVQRIVDGKVADLVANFGEGFARLQEKMDAAIHDAIAKQEPRIEKIVITPLGESKIPGVTHQAFERVLKGAALRQNVLLVGPAGCGKTKLAHQIADALHLPFASLSCSAGMSESQLLGWLLPVGEGGKFEYVASDFVTAYENGGVFLLDELDAADENVLLVLNQALANGGFFLPQRRANPQVKRHPDFVCIAAANTFGHGADMTYAGRNRLDGATLDRFRANIIPMDYDAKLEKQLVDAELLSWGANIRAAIADKKLRRVMSTRALIDFTAQKQAHGFGIKECEASYFADWTRDELTKIGKQIGEPRR